MATMAANLSSLLAGDGLAALAAEGYDSDDARRPRRLVGRHIRVQWGGGRWYAGVVDGFDARNGQHRVRYTDGELRWYRLRDKTFVTTSGDDASRW